MFWNLEEQQEVLQEVSGCLVDIDLMSFLFNRILEIRWGGIELSSAQTGTEAWFSIDSIN